MQDCRESKKNRYHESKAVDEQENGCWKGSRVLLRETVKGGGPRWLVPDATVTWLNVPSPGIWRINRPDTRELGGVRLGKRARRAVNEWFTAILVAAIFMLVVRVFLFAPYEVHGESMYPTFKGEELLIVNMWIYHVSEPQYGDIVVFHTDDDRDFIKRVIGKPGDRISVERGRVIRNGKPLTEPYIRKDSFTGPQIKRMPETVVPKGHLFVLGDNRANSRDSRDLGAIKVSEVVGRADIKVKPLRDFKLLFR